MDQRLGSTGELGRGGREVREGVVVGGDDFRAGVPGEGGNVLVHCLNGWHRTGFFVLGTQALNNVLVLIIHGGVAIYSSNNYVVAKKKLSLVVVVAMYRHTCTVARHSL